MLLGALSNAAYRNGLKGMISDELGDFEIEHTFMEHICFIGEEALINIVNLIEIKS